MSSSAAPPELRPTIELVVNGEARTVPRGTTVATLLGLLAIEPVRVAVERNLDVVPRATWSATELEDGDQLEIVTFVGGG